MDLELDAAAKDFLIEKGYNPDFGARPLRRALSTYIEDALAESLLSGEYGEGHKILVSHANEAEHLTFACEDIPSPPGEDKAEEAAVTD